MVWCGWTASGKLRAAASAPIFRQPAVEAWTPIEPAATFRVTPGEHRVRVHDATGAPLAGAEIWLAPAQARVLDAARSHRLAVTASDGSLALPEAALLPGTELIARAPGHRTARLPEVDVGSTLLVNLRSALQCRVRCTLADGSAVAGVRVVMARSSMPADEAPGTFGFPPGADPRAALYTATTDADGVAVVDGLAAGDFGLQVTHDVHVPAPASPTRVVLPSAEVAIRFVEIVGCVLAPPADDSIVSSGIGIDRGSLRCDVGTMSAVRRVQEGLQRQHQGSFCHALPAGDGGTGRTVRGKVLLRRGGWRTFSVELQPLRQLTTQPLPPDDSGSGPTAGRASLRVASAQPAGIDLGLVLRHAEGGVVCHLPLLLATTIEVPAGSYSIVSENPITGRHLPKHLITLPADQLTEIPIDLGDCHLVQLRVEAAAGEPLGACAIEVEHLGRRQHAFVAADGANVRLMLPAGLVTVQAQASGFAARRVQCDVPGDLQGGPLTLRLDYVD